MSDLNAPATKADLQQLRNEFKQANAELRDELKEAIYDSQTELLKAFTPLPGALKPI